MSARRRSLWVAEAALALAATGTVAASPAGAFELPPICRETPAARDAESTALPELRARLEQLNETDPVAAVALICTAIARAAREQGAQSPELAWWVNALSMPLIAFMNRFDEALPLLEFARPILERELGPFAAEVADIHVAKAWIAQRQGRNVDAAAEWRRALGVRERNPGPRRIELQKVLVGLAHTQSMLRDFAAARASLARARAILAENGATVSAAAAAIENAYINLAWREENFAAARDHARAQIRIEERMGGPEAQLVPGYVWLGLSLERLDELEEAEAALRTAVAIAERKEGAPLQRHHLAALTQLAGLLVARGKPAEARELALRSLALGESTLGAEAPLLIRPLQYLGEAQRALGELPDALRAYERAGTLVERHRDSVERPWIVAHHRGLARVQLELGEREQARASLEEALRAAGTDPTLVVERAATLLALGALSAGSQSASGREALAEALALYGTRLPQTHPSILRTVTEACVLEIALDAARAPSCEEAAVRLERVRAADPFLRHDVHAARAELAGRRGNRQAAYELAIQALSAATTLGTPDPLWRANIALARLLREREERVLAIFFGKESIAQIERLRGRFVGEHRRLDGGFIADKVTVYRTVADWLMEAGRIDEGLEVLRLLKAQELYDFALRDARLNDATAGVELTSEELALRSRYRELLGADAAAGSEIDRLGRLQESGRISADERRQLEALLAGQRQVEAARAERIRQFLASAGSAAEPAALERRTVSAAQLARELERLGPQSALAVYLLTDARLRVLVATRLGQFEYESPIDARALKVSIGRFLDAIGRRETIDAASRSLYAQLAAPLDEHARRAGAKRLVLWLDGALRYVPFAALHDGRGWLIDRYAIESYSPRAAVADTAAEAATGSMRRPSVRGLGLTRAVAGYEPLPAMADELCDVVRGPIAGLERRGRACPRPGLGAGALTGAGFADEAFTEARLRALLDAQRAFSVLHLGTHFSLRPGNARRSFLVLGDGSRLTLDVIGGLDFSGLELVTLSACQSGLGGATSDDGREIEGLSAIVQRRGAQQVVASLWRVDDRSTARLMRAMYARYAAAAGDAAGALRRAQLELRAVNPGRTQPYAHPYYWAGFIVSGARQ